MSNGTRWYTLLVTTWRMAKEMPTPGRVHTCTCHTPPHTHTLSPALSLTCVVCACPHWSSNMDQISRCRRYNSLSKKRSLSECLLCVFYVSVCIAYWTNPYDSPRTTEGIFGLCEVGRLDREWVNQSKTIGWLSR